MNNEPVAWLVQYSDFHEFKWDKPMDLQGVVACEPLYTHPVKEQDGCGNCHACLVGVMENGLPVTFQRMILCPDCGNKRCPKASNHRHQCTESNEPNQLGSIYTNPVNPYQSITDTKIEPTVVSCTHPAKEITDEEIIELFESCGYPNTMTGIKKFARAILRKAQEK